MSRGAIDTIVYLTGFHSPEPRLIGEFVLDPSIPIRLLNLPILPGQLGL